MTDTETTLGEQARELIELHSEIAIPDTLEPGQTFERVLLKLGEYLAKMPGPALNRDRDELETTLGWIGTALGDVTSEDSDRDEADPTGPPIPPDQQ